MRGARDTTATIESLPWPAGWVRRDGTLRDRNEAAAARLGDGAVPFWDAIEPPDRARAERLWNEATAARTTFRLDGYLREPDRRTFRKYCLEARPDGGSEDRLLVLIPASDQSAELALEDRFRYAIEAAGAMVYESDLRSGRILSWHGVAPILCDATAEPRSRREWRERIHPEDLERYERAVESATISDDAFEIDYRVRHARGHYLTVHESTRVLRDDHGLPCRHVGAMIDVSERARAEDTLRRADRNKNELLAMLGHELRNPLAALTSAMDAVSAEPDRVEQLLPVMQRQVRTLGRLVDDLADTARVVRGEIVLRREPVKLEEVVQHALRTATPALAQHGHEPTVELRDASLEAYGDPTRIEQVLVNLLTNAGKYTPAGSPITVVLRRDDGDGVLEVRDAGIGMDAELLPTIFELFTQGDRSVARSNGGLGVGLALSRRLAELHGGTLTAESAGRGLGSTFTLRLPLRRNERPAVATPPPITPAMTATPLRVLVVDDNEDAAEMLARVLSRAGHLVRTAHDGETGLSEAREFEPDVAVLDIGLPRRNGYDLAMAMRSDPTLRDARLIALTGYGTREDRERAKRAGFDHHLTKPADAMELRALMRPRTDA